MSNPPAEYAGKPLPEVRITTTRLLNAETTEKVLNGFEKIEHIRQINISGESLPRLINSGPNKGLDNKHSQRSVIQIVCKNDDGETVVRDVELTSAVGFFFIELNVENEKMLDETVGKIQAVCEAHIEHGFNLDVGRYSKYKPTLKDYRGV